MKYLPIIFILIVVIFLYCLLLFRPKKKDSHKPQITQIPQVIFEYDEEGYNRNGYNAVGKNRQGKYNRFYNVQCYENGLYSDEGFLDIRQNPLFLTNHARDRIRERIGINEAHKMDALAFEAYQYGKSKLQLMKSERGIIEEKEQEYVDSIILIYRGYCYVFSANNGLKTVYKNDRVRM